MTSGAGTPRTPKRLALRWTAALAVASVPVAGVVAVLAAGDAVPATALTVRGADAAESNASTATAGNRQATGLRRETGVPVRAVQPAESSRERRTPLARSAIRPDPERGLVYRGLRRATQGPCVGLFALDELPEECTHGPDVAPPDVEADRSGPPVNAPGAASEPATASGSVGELAATAAGAELAPTSTGSVPCDGDGLSGKRVQVLYVRAASGTDRYQQYLDSFRTWAAGIDTVYDESARETGGSRHVRFVTERIGDTCVPTVTRVAVPASALSDFSATNRELRNQGFDRQDRKYVIFAEADVYCGIGTFTGDTRKGEANRNNSGPSFARADSRCWTSAIAAHELGHTLGAVNDDSPNSTGSGHCVDEYDVMCYSDAPRYPKMVVTCPDRADDSRLDCHHDDYFHTAPAAGSYLATHYNVADNPFLIAPGGDQTQPVTPTASVNPTISGTVTPVPPTTTSVVVTPITATTSTLTTTPPSPTQVPPTADEAATPCGLPERYGGTLAGSGSGAYEPNGSYYRLKRRGTLRACLTGPDGSDFDLYLSRWTGSGWREVARSSSAGSSEQVAYSGGRGYYRWTVRSVAGDGDYTLGMQRR